MTYVNLPGVFLGLVPEKFARGFKTLSKSLAKGNVSCSVCANKYCEESVKSDPEQEPKEEDKRDLTKEEDNWEKEEKSEEEEEDNWEKAGESQEDSEYSDDEELGLMYENDPRPFMYTRRSDGQVFMNKAWLDRETKVREYNELCSGLSVYDAISPPLDCDISGGIVPLDLDEDVLPTLEKLCNVALNKQAPTFVFHNVVKCTHPAATDLTAGRVYYITFQATDKGKPDLTTFQTHVVQDPGVDIVDVDVKKFLIKT
ncbi:uncharacterized protein [Medicago truncatula]|nr:uncharacterized protein LOC11421309 [Medicago truncatula]